MAIVGVDFYNAINHIERILCLRIFWGEMFGKTATEHNVTYQREQDDQHNEERRVGCFSTNHAVNSAATAANDGQRSHKRRGCVHCL